MRRWLICFLFCATIFLTTIALGQNPSKKKPASVPAPPSPVITDELTAYLLPDELKLKLRDGQLEWDELEIDSQKMLVKVEQNKSRQKEISDAIRLRAYQFAQEKQIDLKLWEIDAKDLKFVKKKAAAK